MKKSWHERWILLIQSLLAAALIAASLYFLYRYAQYGEDRSKENISAFGGEEGLQEREAVQPETVQKAEDASEQALSATEEAVSEQALLTVEQAVQEQETATEQETIRVRIKSQDFTKDFHDMVRISCKKGVLVTGEDGVKEYPPEQTLCFTGEELPVETTVCIEGSDNGKLVLESITRGSGVPQYGGKLYLIGSGQGIEVINELPIEQYLGSVVSSEMPSHYPKEALKAQAVCARTYARNCIRQNAGSSFADLDDSVSFQVYNNQHSTKLSKKAVQETRGVVLPLDEIQYYSTSGLTENRRDLGSEAAFTAFLNETPESGAQYGSPWVRWSVRIPFSAVAQNLEESDLLCTSMGVQSSTDASGNDMDSDTQGLYIEKIGREPDGQITLMTIVCGGCRYEIESEYMVRKVLGCAQSEITLLDDSVTGGMELLPSAFFCMDDAEGEVLAIRGCGYGHGNGMSQYGAAEMADKGLDYQEILKYYYGVTPVAQTEGGDGKA